MTMEYAYVWSNVRTNGLVNVHGHGKCIWKNRWITLHLMLPGQHEWEHSIRNRRVLGDTKLSAD